MYAIRNHSLESINSGENGAESCSNGNKKTFCVSISGIYVNAKIVHLKNGICSEKG